MKPIMKSLLAGAALAVSALARCPAAAQESAFGPADAKYTYYWISNKANLPLFVQYDYVGMKRIAEELGVRSSSRARPTSTFRASSPPSTRSARRSRRGVSVVGGWDPSLTEPVKKLHRAGRADRRR